MKTFVTLTIMLIASIGVPSVGYCDGAFEIEAKRVAAVQSLDDYFAIQVEFTNNSPETLAVSLPENGVALGLQVDITAPQGWIRKTERAKTTGITVISNGGPLTLLQIAPHEKQRYVLDLRDFFTEMDLSSRELNVKLQVQAFKKATDATPDGGAVSAEWAGKLVLPVEQIKGTVIRI